MTEQTATVGNWNLPNVLTGVRILLVPVFGFALLHEGGDSILWRCLATAVFAVAMGTDKIDGDIARSRGLVTNFGKIADPIADKAMTGMAFVGLSIVGDIWWWVTILVLLREWSVTLLRLSILKRVVVAAAQSGKVKTVLQAVALTALSLPLLLLSPPLHDLGVLLFYVFQAVALTGLCLPLRQLHPPLHDAGVVLFYAFQATLAVAVAMTMWSGYEFFRDVWRQRRSIRAT